MTRGTSSRLRRLEALESGPAGEGVDVWWMVEEAPGYFQRGQGESVAVRVADLPACPPGRVRVLVTYGEGSP